MDKAPEQNMLARKTGKIFPTGSVSSCRYASLCNTALMQGEQRPCYARSSMRCLTATFVCRGHAPCEALTAAQLCLTVQVYIFLLFPDASGCNTDLEPLYCASGHVTGSHMAHRKRVVVYRASGAACCLLDASLPHPWMGNRAPVHIAIQNFPI